MPGLPTMTVQYTYDDRNRVDTVALHHTNEGQFPVADYDYLGTGSAVRRRVTGDGNQPDVTRDGHGRMTQMKIVASATTADFTYGYDAANRVNVEMRAQDAKGDAYFYDGLGRMNKATRDSANPFAEITTPGSTNHAFQREWLLDGDSHRTQVKTTPMGGATAIDGYAIPKVADARRANELSTWRHPSASYSPHIMMKVLLLSLLTAAISAQQPTNTKPRIVGTPVNCHTIRVVSVGYSADGTLALSASMANDVMIWDMSTGKRVGRIDCKSEPIAAVFGGAKNERIAVARTDLPGQEAGLMLFDAVDGKLLKTIAGIHGVCASPDQLQLIGTNKAGEVVVLDALTGAESARFKVGENLYAPSFTPDGKMLLVDEFMRGKTYFVDVPTQKVANEAQLGRFKASRGVTTDGKFMLSVSSIKITKHAFPSGEELDSWDLSDGPTALVVLSETEVIFGDMDGAVVNLDLAKGEFVFSRGEHRSVVNCLCLSPDRKSVMSGSWDGVVRFWDVATGTERFLLPGHNNAVTAVAFAPDGKAMASGSWDNSGVLWDANGAPQCKTTAHKYAVTAVAVAADGSWWSASQDGTLRHWAKDGRELGMLSYAEDESLVTSIALVHGGKKVACGMSDGNLRWIDAATHTEDLRVDAHDNAVVAVVASDDGTFVATAGGGVVCIWREGGEKPIHTLEIEGLEQITAHDGVVIAGVEGGVLVRIDGKTGKETHRIQAEGSVGSFACVPGHNLLAVAIEGIHWFSLLDLKAQGTTPVDGTIYCVTASADGKQLAAGLEDGTIAVWQLAAAKKRR